MESSTSTNSDQRASQACARCRKAKRRCDKAFPACTLCTRLRKDCDYSESSPAIPNADDFAILKDKVEELEARLDQRPFNNGSNGIPTPESSSPDTLNNSTLGVPAKSPFPVSFFLDADVWRNLGPIPRPILQIPQEIWTFLGTTTEIHGLVDSYFQTIHTWLPVISKKRLPLTLANPVLEPTADLALLLLSMKLIMTRISDGIVPARNDLYWRVKAFSSLIEANALPSTQLLQSLVLLAAYEIGHSIFPSAYILPGHAARLGHAIGLHDRRCAPQMLKKPGSWAEIEEMGRTWWAVMLMDRYVSLGSYAHPLATEDPSRLDILPADDASWDIGEMTSGEPLYVSSKTSLPASWYQRTCQATHLLGRYIRHRDDKLLEGSSRFIEAGQLLRTLNALTALLPDEVERRPEQYCTPIGLCYSALIHLCDPYACTGSNKGEHTVEEVEMQTMAIAGLKQVSADVCRFSQIVSTAMFRNIDATSPLIADCLYNAAATYAWLVHETGDVAHIRSYLQITDVLKFLQARWGCATEFLKMLDQTKKELYEENPSLLIEMNP